MCYLSFNEGHSTFFDKISYGMYAILFFNSPIYRVQTNDENEFTNHLRIEKKSLFEEMLQIQMIEYYPISPATPIQNGKVEHSHREDYKRFYNKITFYSIQDTYARLKKHLKKITSPCDFLFVSLQTIQSLSD